LTFGQFVGDLVTTKFDGVTMKLILVALLLAHAACGEDTQKNGNNGGNNSNNPTNNTQNNATNNNPTNDTVNNVPANNDEEGITRFTLRNASGATLSTAGGTGWVTVKNSGLMAFLWTPTCSQCICDRPCMPCTTPPELEPVAIGDGQARSLTWDGNRLGFDSDRLCYSPQPAEDSSYFVTICYQPESATEDTCETTEFQIGDHVEVVVE